MRRMAPVASSVVPLLTRVAAACAMAAVFPLSADAASIGVFGDVSPRASEGSPFTPQRTTSPGTPGAPIVALPNESGFIAPLGGDDVDVYAGPSIASTFMDIAANGTAFLGVMRGSFWGPLDIYRSADGGTTWALWSTYTDPAGGEMSVYKLQVVDGTVDRLIVAYSLDLGGATSVRVAYADPAAAVPAWTTRIAMTAAGVTFSGRVDIVTDEIQFADWYVYLSCIGSSAAGTEVWFSRSTDLGFTWAAPYVIGTVAVSGANCLEPFLAFRPGGFLHVVWRSYPASGDYGVFSRTATAFAGAGLASWAAPVTISSIVDGISPYTNSFGASPSNSTLFLQISTVVGSFLSGPQQIWYSTDGGASWPAGQRVILGLSRAFVGAMAFQPSTGGVAVLGENELTGHPPLEVQISRSNVATPGVWSAPESFSKQDWTVHNSRLGIAVDPTRGDRLAVAWHRFLSPTSYAHFDAEWRRDPGTPVTELGFPVPLPGGGQTPPAIAELDGDPQGEIVFATLDGTVYALNHDGTAVPGWPRATSPMQFDVAVAVGDLTGDHVNEVVAGTADGRVFVFAANGASMPGWPKTLGTGAQAFVAIGALGPPYAHYVVASSGRELHVLRYDGTLANAFWPGQFTEALTRSAAIGDVDNDGDAEIVTLKTGSVHVQSLPTDASERFRLLPGVTFSDAPTLGDVNNDGDLEIAAPTTDGRMYLFNPDLTDYSASWPFNSGVVAPLTAASLANFLGAASLEMAFGQSGGRVHVVQEPGTEHPAYPKVNAFQIFMPPIVDRVELATTAYANITIGSPLGEAWSWRNLGALSAGWPKTLPFAVEETPASGDIDLDGRNEIVVLGYDALTVLDVGVEPVPVARGRWPMYQYDAARTGCLDCAEDVRTAVDPTVGAGTQVLFANPWPNPSSGPTSFRFALPTAAAVSLEVFDVRGRRVRTVVDGRLPAGVREITWDGADHGGRRVAHGQYLAKLRVFDAARGTSQELTRKVTLGR